ncbi:MAG: STAS/SEC14 domain-containing protein [Myxococcota bacterium]
MSSPLTRIRIALEDGIIVVTLPDEPVCVDLPLANAILDEMIAVVAPDIRKHRLLVELKRMTVDRAARQYLTASERSERLSGAVAMVVDNPLARVVANLFVTLTRPEVPVRLFGDTASARAWLLDQEM